MDMELIISACLCMNSGLPNQTEEEAAGRPNDLAISGIGGPAPEPDDISAAGPVADGPDGPCLALPCWEQLDEAIGLKRTWRQSILELLLKPQSSLL